MKQQYEGELERLEKASTEEKAGRGKMPEATAPQTYTETAVQTEGALDAMIEDPNGGETALPEEIPTKGKWE